MAELFCFAFFLFACLSACLLLRLSGFVLARLFFAYPPVFALAPMSP